MKKILILASFSLMSLSMVATDGQEGNKGWWPFGSSSSATQDAPDALARIAALEATVAELKATISQLNAAQLCEVYPVQQDVKTALLALTKIVSYLQLSSMYMAQASAAVNNELAQVPFLADLLASISIQAQEAAAEEAAAEQAACNCGDNCACGDDCACGDNCACGQDGAACCNQDSCPVS